MKLINTSNKCLLLDIQSISFTQKRSKSQLLMFPRFAYNINPNMGGLVWFGLVHPWMETKFITSY
jgi:hypothetical protein